MRRALAIRHVAFEDLGIMGRLLESAGYAIAYRDAGIDRLDDISFDRSDLLIVLGGPIGAYEDHRYPFLTDELDLIGRCLRDDVPLLGICLGAQLIAGALGARVYPGSAREIGFAPVTLTDEARSSCLQHLEAAGGRVLHWHGDTFDLPAGAAGLASTAITPNQAFALGTRILALQFHIEADPVQLERWLIGHAAELAAASVDVPGLRAQARTIGPDVAKAGAEVLRDWISRI